MDRWAEQELKDEILPLFVLLKDIQKRTRRRPTAVMLPLSLVPEIDTVFDLPVIRGDRTALIYEVGKGGEL